MYLCSPEALSMKRKLDHYQSLKILRKTHNARYSVVSEGIG